MADPALRIMLIVNEFPPQKVAGTAMATRALARALTARGHRVLVVVTTDPPPGGAPEEGYRLCWMGERPWRGVGTSWRIWHAWRAARAFAPHLIQGQAVSCGLVAALVGRMVGVPSITYAQGYDVFEAGRLQARSEIRLGCALADRLLAVTRQLADAIEEKCGVAGAEVVPHGFELPQPLPDREAARRRLGLDDTERLVLAVGRLERFKGHDLLLDGWPEVVRRHPRALLQIAGGGGRLQALRSQAERLGVAGSVRFLGRIAPEAVHRAMAAADLFVLPSRSEPYGIVLLEAMAHGLPVVASRVGGIPEVVPPEGDYRLVPPEDPAALAEAVAGMLDAEDGASERNRRHAMRFVWGRHVARFEAIYRALLAGDSRSHRNTSVRGPFA